MFNRKEKNNRDGDKRRAPERERMYDQKMLDLSRVARVVAGGRRFRFRAVMVIGDRNGKVGIGVSKGADVSMAVEKAVADAKKNMITVPIVNNTIPHIVEAKSNSAKVLLKPSFGGGGVVAGGAVRIVCDLAGIKNVSAKILGRTTNKLNNARATLVALKQLRGRKQTKKEVVATEEKKEKKIN